MIRYFQVLFLFCCFVDATSYRSSFAANQLDIMSGDTRPQLSTIKDSRDDGISYEANRARISMYLKRKYQGKQLEDFSQPGTHKLKLDYWDKPLAKSSDFFLKILETLELSSQSTWVVDITGSEIWSGNGTVFFNVLRRLPSITTLYWREGQPIPLDIVRFLEANHPLCQLCYQLDFGYWGPEDPLPTDGTGVRRGRLDKEALAIEEQERAIARESILNSTILSSLKVSVFNGGRVSYPDEMGLILRILTTCPNIKEFDISVSRGGGCRFYPTDDLWAFDFTSSDETLAPLESLAIDGYRFHVNPNGLNWKEWEADHPARHILYVPWKYLPDSVINYFGYPKIKEWGGLESAYTKDDTSPLKPGTRTNIDIWLERMDWTHLHTLKLKDAITKELKLLGGDTLPSLRNVEFSGYSNHHAILDFLGNISSNLESIHFVDINFCSLTEAVNTVVEHHGSSLRTLVHKYSPTHQFSHVRPRDRKTYKFPSKYFLNTTHLIQLRDNIPGLATLDLDIFVGEEWDYELLDTLTSFSELEYLTLRFEAPDGCWPSDFDCDDDDELFEKYGEIGNKEIANKLYLMTGLKEYLSKGKVGKQFKKLETWVGSDIVGDTEEVS
jgi:hypothetical protein